MMGWYQIISFLFTNGLRIFLCLYLVMAVLIALQSAFLSVLLEWFHPMRNWKIESDLWHHPRKYIVPLIMPPVAGLIGMWPAGI